MKRTLLTVVLVILAATSHADNEVDRIYAQAAARHVQEALRQSGPMPWRKEALVVPNSNVAEAIHMAVAGSVYGDDVVQRQKPYRAVRAGEFWVVFGSLPPGWLGGTAVTVIRASNGEVLRVIHEM